MKVIVIDDEEIIRLTVRNALVDAGHEATSFARAAAALEHLRTDEDVDVALVDLKMPGMDGMTFLGALGQQRPGVRAIVMTAFGTVASAVEAMKLGAYDYLNKPFDTDELLLVLERLQAQQALQEENRRLRRDLEERYGFHQLVGRSPKMQQVYAALEVICSSDCTALIVGETGTGKGMVARAIHHNSARREGPFVTVSCAALSEEILESELFGHVRGAFTGAVRDKKGRFEEAHGGTLFLDEVDDIPRHLQVKLLRVLEDGVLERVGSTRTIAVDTRIIAASKIDLRGPVEAGAFRDDLFYRLNQVPVWLPPLRERREDIPLLVDHFLGQCPRQPVISPAALERLTESRWPGNVRELKHTVERLALFHPERAEVWDLPADLVAAPPTTAATGEGFDAIMAATERGLLLDALQRSGGNQRQAARLLGMPATTLRSRLERLDLL